MSRCRLDGSDSLSVQDGLGAGDASAPGFDVTSSLFDASAKIRLRSSLSSIETVQNLGVITPHFDTDDVPSALRWHDPC